MTKAKSKKIEYLQIKFTMKNKRAVRKFYKDLLTNTELPEASNVAAQIAAQHPWVLKAA